MSRWEVKDVDLFRYTCPYCGFIIITPTIMCLTVCEECDNLMNVREDVDCSGCHKRVECLAYARPTDITPYTIEEYEEWA